jgi:hypothetical protein
MHLFVIVLVILFSASVQAETTGTLGGFANYKDKSNSVQASIRDRYEVAPLQREFDLDYIRQVEKDNLTTERLDAFGKINYAITPRFYGQISARYVDELAQDARFVPGGGIGIKIIRNDFVKLSNELTVGYNVINDKEVVYRDSIWLRVKFDDKNSFTNKFLVEYSDTQDVVYQNVVELQHALSDTLAVGVSHTEIIGKVDTSLTSFNVSVKF